MFLLLSCNELSKSIKDTISPAPQTETHAPEPLVPQQPIPIAASIDALQQAENRLRSLPRFEGKEIVVYRSAHFYDDGRIILNIQDPTDPGIIDRYTYNHGVWQEPEPVRITRSDRVEDNLVSLDKAPFTTANKVYETVRQKLHEINSDQKKVTVYFVPYKGGIRWYPTRLTTERSRYSLAFDEAGNLQSFEQD